MQQPSKTTRTKADKEVAGLRSRLAEAEATLNAIQNGEVDTVLVTDEKGSRVFTLEGADQPYRVLIESMKGGALTLTNNAVIIYANQYFADLVKLPLHQVIGSNFQSLLNSNDVKKFLNLIKRVPSTGSKMQFLLKDSEGGLVPGLLAFRCLKKQTFDQATIGMVVTDLTESKRNEEMLRDFAHKIVDAQEAERRRVAFELHDGITQLLCAMLFQSQVLIKSLTKVNSVGLVAALKLNQMATKTADEVERISRNLKPSVLENLGLKAAFADTCTEYSMRTGLSIKLKYSKLDTRLPTGIELALYRILQEALRNIEKHSKATSINVNLKISKVIVSMSIKDNGEGFNVRLDPVGEKSKFGLGLLSMRERATHLGGTLNLKSKPGSGTEIAVAIPLDSLLI